MEFGSSREGSRFSRVAATYLAAARRDPRVNGYGYLAGDPTTGAPGAFVWFPTPYDLLDFLSSTEVELLQFDDEDASRIVAGLQRAIGRTRDLALIDRDAVSAAFEGWSEILWIGTFGELCEKGGSFITSLRADFRATHELGEHAGPICEDEIEKFVVYLAGLFDPGDVPEA